MKFFKTFFLSILSGLLITILSSYLLYCETWTQTSDINFSSGTLKKVALSGTGDSTSVILGVPSEGAWYDNSWLYRRKLTISHSTDTLSDIQVFLTAGAGEGKLDITGLVNASKVQTDYSDIRFADTDGTTMLPYWIYYSTTAPVGALQGFWVRIKSTIPAAGKSIYMYYGNTSTTTTSSFTDAMTKISSLTAFGNPDTRLKGLWHFDEGTGTTIADASGNGNIGSQSGTFSWLSSGDGGQFSYISTETVKFQTGSALDFSAGGSVNCGTNSSLAFSNSYTLMTWVYFNVSNPSGFPELISRSNYVLYLSPVATGIAITGKYKYELNPGDTSLITVFLPSAMANLNQWYHLAFTFDKTGSGRIIFYLNGQEAASTTAVKASSGTASATFRIGTFAMMDEVAAYNVALTPDEIRADFERRKYLPVAPYISDVGEEVGPWVLSSAYELTGTVTSPTLDTGFDLYGAVWGNITWAPATQTVAGTSLKFQLASNKDNTTWIYHGPDGSTSTYYNNPTTDTKIWFNHDGHRYLRYRAYLTGDSHGTVTPTFEDVTITYSAPSSTEVATTIAAGQAGVVDGNWLKLTIPEGAVNRNVKYSLTRKVLPSISYLRDPKEAIISYDVEAEDSDTGEIVKNLGGLITMSITCTARWSAVDGKYYFDNIHPPVALEDAATKLAIAYFDGTKWNVIGGTVSITNDKATIVASISHLTEYGIVVKPVAGVLATLNVSPNPFTPNSSDSRFNKISFAFPNENAETVVLKVYNMLGKLVKTVTFEGATNTFWDGTDDKDEIVDGGVYIYQLKVGSSVIGKGPIVVAK